MSTELIHLIIGAVLNLLVAVTIVRFIYYPLTQDKNFVFTFLAFNTIVYFVLGMLTSTELSVGVGFGLFAIFSVLRYRTEEMSTREMTYLFIVIALPVMNSILISNEDYLRMLIANGSVVALLFVLEKGWGFHYETSKRVTYERMEWITPANRELLLADLRQRTGLPVKRIEIGRIDFLHDTADIKIYYDEPIAPSEVAHPLPKTTPEILSTRRAE
ncbi:MAG: DUF4956 domain-containing protein [Anaerolineales bacterium]|nr:DUF4956 domain-containing protein [Anaerolineales bacterium]